MYTAARTRIIAGTIAALTITAALAGCTNQPSDPNAWKSDAPDSATATPTPTASTYTPASKPGKASAPKDDTEAWQGASAAVKDYIAVQYEIQRDGGKNPDRIDPYATGQARSTVHDVAAQLVEKKIHAEGEPKWSADAASSDYGALIEQDGTQIANGTVYVRGCYDLSDQKALNADGTEAPVSKDRVGAVQYTTQYIPDDKSWEVSRVQAMADGENGAPTC